MSTAKKTGKSADDVQSVLQSLIAQGRKEGMIRAEDLNAQLEKLDGVVPYAFVRGNHDTTDTFKQNFPY